MRDPLSIVRLVLPLFVATAVAAGCSTGTTHHTSATKVGESSKAAALVTAGLAAQQARHLDQALHDYRAALAEDPHNAYAHYDLGTIEQSRHQNSAAQSDYEAAIAANPQLVGALFNLATLVSSTQPAQAAALYRRVIGLRPGDAAAHLNLGLALLRVHDSAATAELQAAIKLDPSLKSRVPVSALEPGTTTTTG